MAGDEFMHDLACRLREEVPPGATDGELPCLSYSSTDETKRALHGTSTPQAFYLGTGASLYVSAMLPAMLAARHEIILVTCFWAKSKSLADLSAALTTLADHRAAQQVQTVLRVRICFSSRSLLQKLLHTTDTKGYTYPPETWESVLGLPSASVFRRGSIQLVVKSLFFLPFSVMHPKFVIVDRARAFLPSCNVSWEPWLEACVDVTGDVVDRLLQFYGDTWGDDLPEPRTTGPAAAPALRSSATVSALDANGPGSLAIHFANGNNAAIPTAILPSSHHRNPQFRPFFWQRHAPPPATPLNLAIMQLLARARSHIYMQTPNVTAEAVVAALLAALARGVDVTLVTGENMMMYEQIVTALTTTARSLRNLIQRHEAQRAQALKTGSRPYGQLQISYFKSMDRVIGNDEEQAIPAAAAAKINEHGFTVANEEPVQSHAKLTIVDGAYTVLGSGNMDRASFFTSQELGIFFHSADFASSVQMAVDRVLQGRLKPVYPRASA